jgi:hypothetical protein
VVGLLAGSQAAEKIASGLVGAVVGLAIIYCLSLFFFAFRSSAQALDVARTEIDSQQGELRRQTAGAPSLSLERAYIPRRRERLPVQSPSPPILPITPGGRVIQVPVVNSRGSETARSVQALLTFLPDDREGSWSPRHPVLAEWPAEGGRTMMDIPGNGVPHVFNVAAVFNNGYPFVFVWNAESRAADLLGFGVSAAPVEILVEVQGSGEGDLAPFVSDTLRIDARTGIVRADWSSAGWQEATNFVPK